MKRLNLHQIYDLGKALAPLALLAHEDITKSRIYELWTARAALEAMCGAESPLLSSAKRAAKALIEEINQVLPSDFKDVLSIKDDSTLGYYGITIKNGLTAFESVLSNEMPDVAAYIVSRKGIFNTEDLISNADAQLLASTRAAISQQAKEDLKEAGKCLAYEIPTACAFHLWRAVETVAGDYYKKLAGKTFDDDKVQRNWGAYIPALKRAGAEDKVTLFLDHIRTEYRNPHTHPDVIVSNDEAQALLGVAVSSINQMALVMQKVPAKL